MKKLITSCLLVIVTAVPVLADEDVLMDTMQEYLDFAEYSSGTMSVEQIQQIEPGVLQFIDTRSLGRFEAGHIPGAKHIEWREVLNRQDEIPTEGVVVLYCDSGVLSARAQVLLQLAGRQNVNVLLGGYLAWKQ
jgi:rhodanese-related sulfurtransferase